MRKPLTEKLSPFFGPGTGRFKGEGRMNHFKKIQQALSGADMDAVLLTCRANRFYASGFDASDTDGACLITPDAVCYWTDGRYIEAARARIEGAEIGLCDQEHPYKNLFAEAAKAHNLKRLGFDDANMTVADYRRYTEALPCELLPASELLAGLRAVKDEEERGRMRKAQRIAEKVLDEILNDIRPGVTERFLAARLVFLLRCGGAEDVSFDPIVLSGSRTSMPHGVPSDKALEMGDFVTMDFGCKYLGYCSDMTRTVALGHVSEEMETVYHTVLKAQMAGIAAAKAGVTGAAVDSAARTVIEKAGYGQYFTHSFGHGLGVEIHEPPNAAQNNKKPFPSGAVISAEPGIYMESCFGVRIEDVVILGESGCEDITNAPKDLLIL